MLAVLKREGCRGVMGLAAVLIAGAVFCGCKGVRVDGVKTRDSATLSEYLEFCREMALGGEMNCREDLMGTGEDAVATTWERNATYRIVFADAKYLSFRAEESRYDGGAHGGRKITVGTIDRRTGRRLKATDLIPAARRAKVLAALRAAVIRRVGGEGELQGEVTLTDNCYVAKDGIHFVFNEYEVACYAVGAVEAVVK